MIIPVRKMEIRGEIRRFEKNITEYSGIKKKGRGILSVCLFLVLNEG
jgi:hypothetical protein